MQAVADTAKCGCCTRCYLRACLLYTSNAFWPMLRQGLLYTIPLTLVSFAIGVIIAVLCALFIINKIPVLKQDVYKRQPLLSSRISLATTANPLPASPALAASMEAFNASKFVLDVYKRQGHHKSLHSCPFSPPCFSFLSQVCAQAQIFFVFKG